MEAVCFALAGVKWIASYTFLAENDVGETQHGQYSIQQWRNSCLGEVWTGGAAHYTKHLKG
eukprot:4307694-Lingulodinium_polyedra.AAC.1